MFSSIPPPPFTGRQESDLNSTMTSASATAGVDWSAPHFAESRPPLPLSMTSSVPGPGLLVSMRSTSIGSQSQAAPLHTHMNLMSGLEDATYAISGHAVQPRSHLLPSHLLTPQQPPLTSSLNTQAMALTSSGLDQLPMLRDASLISLGGLAAPHSNEMMQLTRQLSSGGQSIAEANRLYRSMNALNSSNSPASYYDPSDEHAANPFLSPAQIDASLLAQQRQTSVDAPGLMLRNFSELAAISTEAAVSQPTSPQEQEHKFVTSTFNTRSMHNAERLKQPPRKRTRGAVDMEDTTPAYVTQPLQRRLLQPDDERKPPLESMNSFDSESSASTARRLKSQTMQDSRSQSTSSSQADANEDQTQNTGPVDSSELKKHKHQMTDRQRRAKIKESMDELKTLVPLEQNQKGDQATIISQSVTIMKSLRQEVNDLRAKLGEMELQVQRSATNTATDARRSNPAQNYNLTNPFASMMSSLNGSGVSLKRIGLEGRVLEVNLCWEMLTGFKSREVVGRSACSAPLYGSLSIMVSCSTRSV